MGSNTVLGWINGRTLNIQPNYEKKNLPGNINNNHTFANPAVLTPDESLLVVGSGTKFCTALSTTSDDDDASVVWSTNTTTESTTPILISPDNQRMYVANNLGQIVVKNMTDGKTLYEYPAQPNPTQPIVADMTLSDNGMMLVYATSKGMLRAIQVAIPLGSQYPSTTPTTSFPSQSDAPSFPPSISPSASPTITQTRPPTPKPTPFPTMITSSPTTATTTDNNNLALIIGAAAGGAVVLILLILGAGLYFVRRRKPKNNTTTNHRNNGGRGRGRGHGEYNEGGGEVSVVE